MIYLKNLLLDNLASPLFFKNTVKIQKNLVNHKKKKYYVIHRSPGAGMFSNITHVLNHIIYAKKKKLIPVIDMENFTTIYNEKKKIFGSFNAWDYYFEKISKISLKKIYKRNNYILSNQIFLKNFINSIDKNKITIKEFKKLKIKKYYYDEANLFYKKQFSNGKKVLGVHLRSTSYKKAKNHAFPPSLKIACEEIDRLVKKEKYDKIFCVTEDLKYMDLLKKKYKKNIIFFDSFRSKNNEAFNIYPRKLHRYKLGKEIIIETILLSKCKGILFSISNVATAATLLSKNKIKIHQLNLGFNSSNKFIARWLWYIKKIIPKKIGGLKVESRIEKIL